MSLGQKVNQSFVKKEILSGCHPSKNHEQISFGLGKKEEGKKRNQNPQNPYLQMYLYFSLLRFCLMIYYFLNKTV